MNHLIIYILSEYDNKLYVVNIKYKHKIYTRQLWLNFNTKHYVKSVNVKNHF